MSSPPPTASLASLKTMKWQYWALGGGAIIGVAWYLRSKHAPTVATTDTSTDSTGVGTTYGDTSGVTPGLYGYQDPSTGAIITPGSGTVVTGPSNNAQWAQTVTAYLESVGGYSGASVLEALGKYLAGAALTDNQLAIVQAGIAAQGYPPNPPPPPHVAPPAGQTGTTPATGKYHYAVEEHAISANTPALALIKRFSDASVATNSRLAYVLTLTAKDPANARYLAYFSSHGGSYKAGSRIRTHVVKAG